MRRISAALTVVLLFSLCACAGTSQAYFASEVLPDFSDTQVARISFGDTEFFAYLSYDAQGGLCLKQVPPAKEEGKAFSPEIRIFRDTCVFKSGERLLEKPLSECPERFLPGILYRFFRDTDFSTLQVSPSGEPGQCAVSQTVGSAFVTLSVTSPSPDKPVEIHFAVT